VGETVQRPTRETGKIVTTVPLPHSRQAELLLCIVKDSQKICLVV